MDMMAQTSPHTQLTAMLAQWRQSMLGDPRDADAPVVRRWRQTLCKQAVEHWKNMDRAPGRRWLWPDLPDPGHPYPRDSVCLAACRRLETMALAWRLSPAEGTPLPVQLHRDLIQALEFISDNWYGPKAGPGGEWWHREIGLPLCLGRCVALLYEDMPLPLRSALLQTIARYTDDPTQMCLENTPEISTGANRVWKCMALTQCGILCQSPAMLDTAAAKIQDVFCFVRQGDGFYDDGSFIQHHKFAYTGGYGVSFLETIAAYMHLLRDTPWALDAAACSMVATWVENVYAPLLCRGACMSMVRGREIARQDSEEHAVGHRVLLALLMLTDSLPAFQAQMLRRKIKTWLQTGAPLATWNNIPAPWLLRLQHLLADARIEPWHFADSCHVFAVMDKVVHHRSSFSVALSLCSARTGRYESIHGENLRGWYTADGMMYLYNSDLYQFSDGYFPTVDACRLPGITADGRIREACSIGFGQEPRPTNQWAGGACLHGRYGAVGMDLQAEGGGLTARKSWFLFDREIVCLGAGICGGGTVETIVENRKVSGHMDHLLRINGGVAVPGRQTDAVWAHLQGETPGSDIGYLFLGRQTVVLQEEDRTGSWRDINNEKGTTKALCRHYIQIRIAHGAHPRNAGYAYALLPGKTQLETAQTAHDTPFVVLYNTRQIQAVWHRELQLLAVHFWQADRCEAAGLDCSGPASILIQKQADKLHLAVADPTWQTDTLILKWARPATLLQHDPSITLLAHTPVLRLQIHTGSLRGKTAAAILQI